MSYNEEPIQGYYESRVSKLFEQNDIERPSEDKYEYSDKQDSEKLKIKVIKGYESSSRKKKKEGENVGLSILLSIILFGLFPIIMIFFEWLFETEKYL